MTTSSIPHFAVSRRIGVEVTRTPQELSTLEFPVDTRNHNYALISYVAPYTTPKGQPFAMRIYCTCATQLEAEGIAESARSRGFTDFDLHIVDIAHGFFPMPPPADMEIANVSYADDVLNNLIGLDQNARVASSKRLMKRVEDPTRTPARDFAAEVHRQAKALFASWQAEGEEQPLEEVQTRLEQAYKDAEQASEHAGDSITNE